ncbi:MAG: Coenzyme F420 hydrogenase/dehydrogenase, beta subunit C-terminal domain [Promethearchaeota archaeon]
MTLEGKITWDFLKNISDTINSYRVRAFIDAKDDILNAGIYNESSYYNILFKMFEEEQLKYSLFRYLKSQEKSNLDSLKQFSTLNSIELKKTLFIVYMLKHEKLIEIVEVLDEMDDENMQSKPNIFKDLLITCYKGDITKVRTVYEPTEVIFRSKVCSGCGICSGICPMNCITLNNGFGIINDEKCIRCGLCYLVCPRSFLPLKALYMYQDNTDDIKEYGKVGPFLEAYAAQTKVPGIKTVCQDGGITSTCLYYLFEQDLINIAIGAKTSEEQWRPEPFLMEKKEDVIKAAGTKYVNSPNLQLINDNKILQHNIAVVGVPCQMQALLKSKVYDTGFPSLAHISYRIGIFCMESFQYDGFLEICEKLNVDVNDVKKTDINKGKFFIYTLTGEELSIPIKEISNLAREDCKVCYDLTSESADISIGSIGAPSGWNIVLIRTQKGKELYHKLIKHDLIESKNIEDVKPGLSMLQKIAGTKRNTCQKHIDGKKKKNERYPIY